MQYVLAENPRILVLMIAQQSLYLLSLLARTNIEERMWRFIWGETIIRDKKLPGSAKTQGKISNSVL